MMTDKQKSNPILFFILCFIASFSFETMGQVTVDKYLFNRTNSNYVGITGGTVLGGIVNDEQVFISNATGGFGPLTGAGFPIGFPFSFGGNAFTRFAVGTNGYIKLGEGTFTIGGSVASAFSSVPFNLADTNNYNNLIGAFHGDIEGQTGSELSYKLIGSAPNRELVVQWKKYQFYNTQFPEDLNFQIRLLENGNKVIFSYGNFVKNQDNRLVSLGLRGKVFSLVQMRRIRIDSSETWATSGKSNFRGSQCDVQTNFKPANGLTFTFEGLPPIANDLAISRIILSKNLLFGCPGSSTEPVKVLVQNFGTNPQNAVNYTLKVNGNTLGSGSIPLTPPLQSNQSREVTLTQTINVTQAGTYDISAWSTLDSDTGSYQNNDTVKAAYTFFAPIQGPFTAIRSLAEFNQKGWKSYNGANSPSFSGSSFINSPIFSSPTTAVSVSAFSSDTIQEWLISPAVTYSPGMRLKFRAAITSTFDTSTTIAGIGNDEFKVLISTNCGQTWETLRVFNNASITNGELSNVKTGYSVPIAPQSSPFQIAFFVANKGSAPSESYVFHLDDVTVSLGNAYDLAVGKLTINTTGNSSCSQTVFPVQVWLKNKGDSSISASSASIRVNAAAEVNQNFIFSPILAPGDSFLAVFPSIAIAPNSVVRVLATAKLATEDGYSAANDTVSTAYIYIGSANPIQLPASVVFDNLPTGVPAGWFVDQGQGTDFRVRVRGVNSSRSLSANLYSSNRNSFAIMPSTQTLPANYLLSFSLRLKNDAAGSPFSLGANDSIVVRASDNCGSSFQALVVLKQANAIGIENFGTVNVDLSAYVGKVVSIRFEAYINRSDFSGCWVDIDNIGIAPNTSVGSVLEADEISLFPNPASQTLYISINNSVQKMPYKLFGLEGKLVKDGTFSSMDPIDVSRLKRGVYFIEFGADTNLMRKKLVLN